MKTDKMSSAIAYLMAVLLVISGLSVAVIVEYDDISEVAAEEEDLKAQSSLRPATRGDIERLKLDWGVYEPGKDYNIMFGDKGTGLTPPTEEQYDTMARDMKVSENGGVFTAGEGDRITELLTKDSDSLSYDPPLLGASSSITDTPWMPPIGDQGGQGSTGAFSAIYYSLSIMTARDYGYDINTYGNEIAKTGSPPTHADKIMSPGWAYNMVNGGEDQGSNWFGSWDLSNSVGNSDWETKPYDHNDYTSWGDETAFRNAAQYRSTGYETFNMADFDYDTVLTYIKTSIDGGHAVGFAIDANGYPITGFFPGTWEGDHVIASDEWVTEDAINHAQTVIGYDDNMADTDGSGEVGAFHIANSWGDWGPLSGTDDTGTYWMTYECFINHLMYQWIYRLTGNAMYDDTTENSPQLLGTWRFSDNQDRDPDVWLGIADSDGGVTVEEDLIPKWDGASKTLRKYPTFLSVDLTEYVDTWDNGAGANYFALYTGETRGTASTISSWNVEYYDGGYVWNDGGASAIRVSVDSPDAPATNPCTMWTTFAPTTGRVTFDQEKYGVEDTIGIIVEDEDLIGAESVNVTIVSDQTGDSETVTLTENARYPHIFEGSIACSATDAPGVLHVSDTGDPADIINVTYDDSGTFRTTIAYIDVTPPVLIGGPTSFSKLGAVVEWTSDELATSEVNYGLYGGPLDMAVSADTFTRNHSIVLDRLDTRGRTYHYEIVTVNEAGLTTTNDDDGNYYTFITTDLDDVEAGNVGWTFGGPKSKDGRWAPRSHNVLSGEFSWNYGNGQYGNGWWDLMESPVIATEGWESGEWTWWHAYKIEKPGGTDYWDGFVVEVRHHDGSTWSAWDRAFPDTTGTSGGGYDGAVYSDYDGSPFAGEEVFGGYSGPDKDGSWVDERVDLSPWLPAQYIQVRYYFASDDNVREYGLDIDDIRITSSDGIPEIMIIQPVGGETLSVGDTYEIQWSTVQGSGTITHVDLWYSVDAGRSWITIDTDLADNGSYTWTVPDEESTECLVRGRVYADDNFSGTDTSDDSFNIIGAPTYIYLFAEGPADGWNFVSFDLIPLDTTLSAILTDINGSYDRLMYYDASADQWMSYVPDRAAHFNNLNTWDHTMGIWIRMTVNDTLNVNGTTPTSTDITLYPGWNMVGLPSSTSGNHGLPADVSRIGYFNATATYNLAYNYEPGSFTFEPGQGYWLYLDHTQPVVWTVDY